MKKLFLSLAIAISCIASVNAQAIIISGHVTNFSSAPVPNHQVTIVGDSSNGVFYYNTVLTDANGFYIDSASFVGGMLAIYNVFTLDCTGSSIYQTVTSTSAPITVDFQICDSIPAGGCGAAFQAYPDSSGNYYFNDYSSNGGGNIISWSWYFGDGTTSTLQNPIHQYAPGIYGACLTIATDQGCTSTFCDTIYAGNPSGCNSYFVYNNSGNTYTFQAYPTGNAPYQFTWNFDNGTIIGPGGSSSVTNTFATSGYYYVCLTTVDANMCTSTYCEYIYVNGNNYPCSANFFLYPDSTILHQYYAVNMAYGTGALSYLWSWGDGTSSTGAYPSHAYANDGYYTICLTINDSAGCTSTFCDSTYIQKSGNSIVNVNVIPNGSTGINEVTSENTLSIYPNPAQNILNIENVKNNAEVSIIDISGKTVMSIRSTKNIDISNLAKGMYCVKVIDNKTVIVKRFIKE